MHQLELGFVGAGNMAGGIIKGMVDGKALTPAQIGVYDVREEATAGYREQGCAVFDSIAALASACKVVVLAVKPQIIDEVLPEVKQGMSQETVILSIAAGVPAAKLKAQLGQDAKVVLCIPNSPIELGLGATALARVSPTTGAEFDEICRWFKTCGTVGVLPEEQMCTVIAVSSSSPAFVYRMADVMVTEAKAMGMDGKVALELFCQTLTGSAAMLRASGGTAKQLIDKVCSPGGTTLAAFEQMDQLGFDQGLKQAFRVCVERAKEIGK